MLRRLSYSQALQPKTLQLTAKQPSSICGGRLKRPRNKPSRRPLRTNQAIRRIAHQRQKRLWEEPDQHHGSGTQDESERCGERH